MSLWALFRTPPPDVAVEIAADRVSAARLSTRGAEAVVAAYAVEPLAAGLVVPGLLAANLTDLREVGDAVRRAVTALGGRVRRVALVVPDPVARVTLVRFETVPARQADLDELVRWQVRKSVPFPLDQAVVSHTPGGRPVEGGVEFIVAAARHDVIGQYEAACAQAGLQAGLVDLATFSVINGVLASRPRPDGDWLLVNATRAYTTLAVVRDDRLIFIRSRGEDTDGSLADVVHQTAMYYEDRLHGSGFRRVLLAGGAALPGGAEAERRALEERLRVPVEAVDPRLAAGLVDRIGASPELLDALGPMVGVLLRERRAA
ncbi:MAG: pilus assembly protein PilM [Acidobacteriota bacterium]